MDTLCPHCDQTVPHRIEKYCPKCEETLPHIRFSPNRAAKDGLSSWCKACRNADNKTPKERATRSAYMHGWQDRNREKVNANAVEAYYELKERREADPDLDAHLRTLARAKSARARRRDPEKARQADQTYKAKPTSKKKANARRRIRYAEDPDKFLASGRKWRANKRQAPINDLTTAQWKAVKEHYGHRCAYCGKKSQRLTQDHITPLSANGPNTLWNVVPACRSCNARKNKGPVLIPVQPLLLV